MLLDIDVAGACKYLGTWLGRGAIELRWRDVLVNFRSRVQLRRCTHPAACMHTTSAAPIPAFLLHIAPIPAELPMAEKLAHVALFCFGPEMLPFLKLFGGWRPARSGVTYGTAISLRRPSQRAAWRLTTARLRPLRQEWAQANTLRRLMRQVARRHAVIQTEARDKLSLQTPLYE